MEQLPLGVRLRAASTFESFLPGANAPVVAALESRAATSAAVASLPPIRPKAAAAADASAASAPTSSAFHRSSEHAT